MEVDPTRVCELLVGLGDVTVLGAVDDPGGPVRVHVETLGLRPPCPGCGGPAWVKDRRKVELIDLAAFGRPARLVWHKRRWTCPAPGCATVWFTESAPWIAAARLVMTDRAGVEVLQGPVVEVEAAVEAVPRCTSDVPRVADTATSWAHSTEQGVLLTVDPHLNQFERLARRGALLPQLIPRGAPEDRRAGRE